MTGLASDPAGSLEPAALPGALTASVRMAGAADGASRAADLGRPAPGTLGASVRADFPILDRTGRAGGRLIYLDSAATAHKPLVVADAVGDFALRHNAAVHRGAHLAAEEATELFEQARDRIGRFFGVGGAQVVLTANATGAVNLVAGSVARASAGRGGPAARRLAIGPGDRIVVTEVEHHSNLVPWQELAALTGAELAWVPLGPDGRLRTEGLGEIVTDRTRIVAFTQASNVTGAVTDVAAFVAAARAVGAISLMDAAQGAPHLPLDLAALGVDAAAVSAHKMLGPSGTGALIAQPELLQAMPPVAMGGSMVEIVTMREATYKPPPQRFEAGTQAVAEVVGWAAAIDYLDGIGMAALAAHEQALTARLLDGVAGIGQVRLLGPPDPADRLGVVSVDVAGVHPHDVGQVLDAADIAVRVGHHCAQPAHRALGVAASTRASIYLYTTADDVDAFLEALSGVRAYFGLAR